MSDILGKLDLELARGIAKMLLSSVGIFLGLKYLEYVDAQYSLWLSWLLAPLLVTFLLPAVLVLLIYTSAIIFHLHKLYKQRLLRGVEGDWRHAARQAVCALWDAHGWLWHGYEISGLENLPDGPCLIIYYHGALPIDMYYFTARMYLLKRRLIHSVADRILFKIPGWSIVLETLCVIPGTVQTCVGILRGGNSLAISPGGVYEAQFGDHHYQLNWRERIGFAKVALESKVPIVPLFTQNVREAFRTVGWLRGLWLRIYSVFRLPLAPVYGGFPVKLLSHIGPPIYLEEGLTPHQVQAKVAKAIEALVEEHQRVPGSILRALLERFHRVPKIQKSKERRKSPKARDRTDNNGSVNIVQQEAVRKSEKFVDRNTASNQKGDERNQSEATKNSDSFKSSENESCVHSIRDENKIKVS